jgi:homoserine kinase
MAAPMFRAAAVRVRVPATSANLGPGFDTFGLALDLYDEVVVRVGERGLDLDVVGEGADVVRRDERNLVVKAMYTAFRHLGGRPRGIEVRCLNRIPHGRGLGSSAAAIVAGIVAARAITVGGDERLDAARTLALATEMEGHPDNVAAALHGGFCLAWTDAGQVGHVSLPPHESVVPVVFIPTTELTTTKARRLLPEQVSHADAVISVSRAALMVEALTHRPDLLMTATQDCLHQEYRRSAMPRSLSLVADLRAVGVPAVVSGAGPSVLALTDRASADAVADKVPSRWRAARLEPSAGVEVLPLS